ncbi:MAG: DMT family transporter [Candidatus Micrarchaeia archaeon]
MDNRQAGVAFGIATMLTVAILPVSSKFSIGYVNPLLFSSFTLLVAALASYAILAWQGRQREFSASIPRVLKLAAFSYVGFSALFFIAQSSLTAVESMLLAQSEPFFAIIFSVLVLSERISLQRLAITAIMAAVIVVFIALPGGSMGFGLVPVLMLFASMASMQFGYSISMEEIETIDPLVVCSSASLLAGLGLFALGLAASPSEMALPSLWIVPYLVFHGLVGWLIAYVAYYEAIRRIGLSFSTAMLIPSPIISIWLANAFLGEVATQSQVAGLVLVIACLALLVVAGLREKAGLPAKKPR